jgi:isopenicillin N synthase-like dioxygenase
VPTPASVLPVVDVAPLVEGSKQVDGVASAIDRASREHGFFYVAGHGVDESLFERLEKLSRELFAFPLEEKLRIRMELGGRAWRGYFPVGQELTSGLPDQKEGLYFGAELPDDDPRVAAGLPLHGRNLFPARPAALRDAVLETIDELTRLGHVLMEGIALSLELERSYFAERYTGDPTVLFRVFHYPPLPPGEASQGLWSVGEHTDYGLLTILRQDRTGGLQVKARGEWIDAPPLPGTLVCNLGDMLDRMTGGRYRSMPHRVRNASGRGRFSFPFFFDPAFDAEIQPIRPATGVADDRNERWDRESVHAFGGTYGEYLLRKVGRVFPELGEDLL